MSTHTTSFQSGDDFLFQGLTGTPQDEGNDRRIIHIMSVSATGRLCFRIDSPDKRGEHLYDIAYSEALLMVEEGIWTEWTGR